MFYSIQGEGLSTGEPSLFIRFTGCNLNCIWCDTTEVWKKGEKHQIEDVLAYIDSLGTNISNIVITGGEPLLQQIHIVDLINAIEKHLSYLPKIEVETNCTLYPLPALSEKVSRYNLSPKLPNSGYGYNEDVLKFFQDNLAQKTSFKFVVESESEVLHILKIIHPEHHQKILLMPQAATEKELKEISSYVIEMCKKYSLRFSTRLHIAVWNRKTGV